MATVRIDSTSTVTSPTTPARDSGWAAGAHLIGLFFSIPGAIIAAVSLGRHDDFVRQHARQSVCFQLNLLAAAITGMVLTAIAPIMVLTWIPMALAAIVLPIVAATRANRGEWRPYPPMVPFLRELECPKD